MNTKINKKAKMIKILVFSVFLLMLTAIVVSADDARVSTLNLSPQSGETVLKIDVAGPFQFTHETAEAKDGKPFRVVVDIFPAIHDLGQKEFVDLPKTILSSIRTSQYSVDPEKVVRVVCDLNETVMYRVEKKGGSIYLYLPDKKSGNFTSWSSLPKAPVTVAKVSNDTKKEEPAKKVVKKKVVKKVETASVPVTAKAPEKEAANLTKPFQTKSSDSIDHDKFLSAQKSVPKVTQVASVPASKPESEKKNTVEKKEKAVKPVVKSEPALTTADIPAKEKTAQKKVVKVDEPKSEPKSGQPVQEYTMVKKDAPAVEKSDEKPIEVASIKEQKTEKSKEGQKPTSRFRRKPTFPNKLKGTIVAEFPTRIVMKYNPGTSRDPFDNLLTEAKGADDPIQKKIPDVETAKLVGVLESSDGQKRALLEDHDGYGYILKSGDKIKKGYVGKIYSDKAYFKLFEYGWSRTVALYMSIN